MKFQVSFIYAGLVLIALILAFVTFIINSKSSKKFLSGPIKSYITLKFYAEFFMMIFLITYLSQYLMQGFNYANDTVLRSINFVGVIFLIFTYLYLLFSGYALKKLGDLFGFAKDK
jgi:hypothetical protein